MIAAPSISAPTQKTMPHRIADLIGNTHHAMPTYERILALLGGGYALAMTQLDSLSTWVGICVGIATFTMILPRAILGWGDVARAVENRRRRRRDALRLLREAEADCEGCCGASTEDPATSHPLPPEKPETPSGKETSAGS